MEWFTQNKEWIFSGIGVFIISILISVISSILKVKASKRYKRKYNIKQGNKNIITGDISSSNIKIQSNKLDKN